MDYDFALILNLFRVETSNLSFQRLTNGYINDTFLVSISKHPKYILQRINHHVLKTIRYFRIISIVH